jgi:hypothetical protein
VRGQHHRGGVQHRPVGHRARVRPGRRARERHPPAARAHPARQQPLGHLLDHFRVNDLRPPRLHGFSAIQARLATAALRGRIRGHPLIRAQLPLQAFPLMTGLTAPPAVLTAFPLRPLPRPPRFLRPDPLLRRRRPRIRAVHRQPALQLRHPQPKPPPQLPLGIQLPPEQRNLGVLRLHHSPQPRQQLSLLRDHVSQAGLLRHASQACSTCTNGSNTRQNQRVAQRPREWTTNCCLDQHVQIGASARRIGTPLPT